MSKMLSESRFQHWRAIAINGNTKEHLLCLGSTSGQVKSEYASAFAEILTTEEREQIKTIELQHWSGTADCGTWRSRSGLAVPRMVEAIAS